MNKAQILDEIKRTAAGNGGVPLGRERFFTETGIKQSACIGVFWARWGDALREAGFTPNQLKESYPAAELLAHYADLAVELGRLPTNADVRLKSRSSPDFPSHTTIARLGSKSELITQLADYCRNREGLAVVVRWCAEYTPRDQDESESDSGEQGEFGFVYLIKSGRFYKIGMTNSIGRREYELGLQLPEAYKTVHVIRTDDPNGIEAYWHNRFAAKRKNGEWFELNASDIAAFRRGKFM